jgi:retron-type reverse transcriptase
MASLTSFNNIKLAWIRTLAGENTDYRTLQRIEIDSFGWAEEDNLLHLQKELQDRTFSPSQASKIYLPKPSGLLRPISIIRVKDTIVYQAIANIMAENARRRLSRYYFITTFSNILTSKSDYPHFYRQWKYGRSKLDLARKQAFSQGHSWLGELDIASFYDVIDHDLLRSALKEFYKNEDVLKLLFLCLTEWTIHPAGFKHSHGIPQGPLPSSFIAECVLHLLDKRVTNLTNSIYLRYVDDITIMSKNEKNAKQAFAQIEVTCRELGLVPKVKRPIQELHDIEDLIFPEPSPIQINPYFPSKAPKKQSDAARRIFLGCFYRGKLRSEEEQLISKLNFSLFRMNPDRRVLNKVTGLLGTMPCVATAMNYYLRKFENNKHICSCLFDYLDSEPIYDFVSASCLETLNFICARGHFSKLSNTCRKFLSKKHHTILRSTAVKILGFRNIRTNVLLQMVDQNNDVYLTEHLLLALSNSLPNLQKQQILSCLYLVCIR